MLAVACFGTSSKARNSAVLIAAQFAEARM